MGKVSQKKLRERYCIKKTKGTTTTTIPFDISNDLKIRDGEKPDWKKAKHATGNKLTIKVIRGETIYED